MPGNRLIQGCNSIGHTAVHIASLVDQESRICASTLQAIVSSSRSRRYITTLFRTPSGHVALCAAVDSKQRRQALLRHWKYTWDGQISHKVSVRSLLMDCSASSVGSAIIFEVSHEPHLAGDQHLNLEKRLLASKQAAS